MRIDIHYVCDICGEDFYTQEACERHEVECKEGKDLVTVALYFDGSYYTFHVSFSKACSSFGGTNEDFILSADDNCNHFYVRSKNTSKTHIKELKDKLIDYAIERIKENRTQQLQAEIDRLEKLRNDQPAGTYRRYDK